MYISQYARGYQSISDNDKLFVLAGLFCLCAGPVLIWMFLRPAVPITRYQVTTQGPDGCKAEVWVTGTKGDSLVRLMQPQKYGPPIFTGVALIHENLTSSRVSTTVSTPQGRCEIVRWRLLVNGQQTDSLKRHR